MHVLLTRRALGLAAAAAIMVSAAPLRAASGDLPVPPAIRRQVMAFFAPSWVLPDTVMYRWDALRPTFGGDQVVCGWVNYQNSTRVYVGWRAFYAIVHGAEIPTSAIQPGNLTDGISSAITKNFNLLCDRHIPVPN